MSSIPLRDRLEHCVVSVANLPGSLVTKVTQLSEGCKAKKLARDRGIAALKMALYCFRDPNQFRAGPSDGEPPHAHAGPAGYRESLARRCGLCGLTLAFTAMS
jgi:hypothetical protein